MFRKDIEGLATQMQILDLWQRTWKHRKQQAHTSLVPRPVNKKLTDIKIMVTILRLLIHTDQKEIFTTSVCMIMIKRDCGTSSS